MPLPPLVAPGPPLTPEETVRLSRHLLLPQLGELGQRRLRNARVCVIGAGGLGAPALLYLAAAGVGTIGIVDDDVVDLTNLQRQVIHGVADVGRLKVDSASDRLLELSPAITLVPYPVRLTEQNAADILGGHDLVLDGTDNFATRYLVNDTCAELGIPLVWASVFQFDAQVSVFWSRPADGRAGVGLRDLFPAAPPEGSVPSCAQAGVFGALCGQVGSLMANEAIKLVTGIGETLLGRVLVLDSLAARWTELPLRPASSPATPVPVVRVVSPVSSAAHDAVPHAVPHAAPHGTPSSLTHATPSGITHATPSGITHISIAELEDRLAARRRGEDSFELVDVRDPAEHAAGAIPGSRLIPLPFALTEGGRTGLPPDRPVILYCKVGPRSDRAARAFAEAGFTTAVLTGGIDAWEDR